MIEDDTVKLLRECDAGIKMGVCSIDDVLEHVKSPALEATLTKGRKAHLVLKEEIQTLLGRYQDEGKAPSPMAKSMSHMKTAMKLGMENSDSTVADLMTDGCNMGIKSLSKYLNQYKAADEKSRSITRRLIDLEHQMTLDMRSYL